MDNTVVDLETLQSLYDNVSCLKYINDYTLRFFIGKCLMTQTVTEGKNKHVLGSVSEPPVRGPVAVLRILLAAGP
jgi:hypothetical protein